MKADVKAPRNRDVRDAVRKLTLEATNDWDGPFLSRLSRLLFYSGTKDGTDYTEQVESRRLLDEFITSRLRQLGELG